MKLNYIISSTTKCATTKTLEQVIKQAESDVFGNYVVIVPEPKSIAIERELLDLSSSGAFSNVFIYSFVRLLDRVGGIDESKIVSKQTCVMLLRQIILDNADKLKCYKKAVDSVGFAEKIYDTIQQFKSSGVTTNDLVCAMQTADESLKVKLEDICLIYEEYQKVLGNELFDDCDRLNVLCEFAKTNEFIKNSEMFIVGFDNVTTEMISVLKEFAVNAKSVTFSCCYFNENRKDKYIQSNELYKKFTGIAEKLKYPYVPTVFNPTLSGDFWNIQNYLYSTENKKVEGKGNVEILEFASKQQEIEFVANQIIQEVKNGKRFRDIAVVDSELEADENLIKQIFSDYNIPYFLKKSYNISNHFFVRFIRESIDVFRSHLSSDKVLCWLSNTMTLSEGFETFENYVNEHGVNYSGFLKPATEESVQNQNERDSVNKVIEFIAEFYDNFKTEFQGEKTVTAFVETVDKMMDYFDSETKLNKIYRYETEQHLFVEAEISNDIYKKVKQINENFKKFLGGLVVNVDKFLQIYISGFSDAELNLEPISVDSVVIYKSSEGLYKIKDLFVVGAVEGKFPVSIQNSGIILDEELIKTGNAVQKEIEPTVKQINKRENYSVYETLLVPTEKLYVSYSLKNLAGGSNKPARVISRLVNLLNLEIKKDFIVQKNVSFKASEREFAKEVGEYLAYDMHSQNELNDKYNMLKGRLSKNFKRYLDNVCFGEKDFTLSNAKKIFFYNDQTSISQLEQFFACPYAFFVQYGLRLKENKKAAISSPDIGTIIHKFVELFIQELSKFESLSDEKFEAEVKNIFDETLKELNINLTKNVSILKFIYDESQRLAKYIFKEQQCSNFKNKPELNEFKFKAENAVKLKINNEKIISLEGVIDRIDKFGNYIRIIDYKTGKIDNHLSAIYYGKKIQLISYLHAATKIKDQKVAGLFYFPIHSDFVKIEQKIKNNYKMTGFLLDDIDVVKNMDITLSHDNPDSSFVPLKIKSSEKVRETGEFEISHGNSNNYLTESEFESVKNYNEKLCVQAISEIFDGFIEPSPLKKITDKISEECEYCEFAGFCGKEHAKFGMGRNYVSSLDVSSFNDGGAEDGN